MSGITEAQQLATALRAALCAPAANDAWNRLHLVSVKDHLLARVPAVLAQLEQGLATHPDQQAQIQALLDDLKALQLRGVSP